MLIVGRVVQGIGGGGVYVLTEIIVTDITNLKERAFYVWAVRYSPRSGLCFGTSSGGEPSRHMSVGDGLRGLIWYALPREGLIARR